MFKINSFKIKLIEQSTLSSSISRQKYRVIVVVLLNKTSTNSLTVQRPELSLILMSNASRITNSTETIRLRLRSIWATNPTGGSRITFKTAWVVI